MSPPVKKAVIPAAGLGTRFLPAAKAQPKEMIPLVDKPAIQYVVEEAVSCGITDILIITGRNKRAIEDHFDRSPELEANLEKAGKLEQLEQIQAIAALADIHCIRQAEPRGLGHAIGMGRHHVGDQPFAVLLPDDLMHEKSGILAGMLAAHEQYHATVLALKTVTPEEVSQYGCAAVDEAADNIVRVRDVVEKPSPEDAPSNLGMMGRYVFNASIFDAIDRTPPGRGDEIQITDSIKLQMESEPVYGYTFSEGRFDAGNKIDYLKATVELALERDDLGPPLRAWLQERLQRP